MAQRVIPGPFDVAGNWFRGCLHSHTTESDGWMPPERLVEHYRRAGYDFLALTDHGKLTDRASLSTPSFLVVRGTELDVGRSELGQRFHLVGVGIQDAPRRDQGMTAADAVAEIHRLGGEAILAHPYWSGLTAGDLLGLDGCVGVEVFNTSCETGIGRGNSQYVMDEVLTRGKLVRFVAADDTHRPGADSLKGWTMVRAPELTEAALLEALRQGHFYASTGPEVRSVVLRDGRVEVECSPAQAIQLVCDPTRGSYIGAGGWAGAVRASRRRPEQMQEAVVDGQLLTGATFELSRSPRYARVQVIDPAGRMAWTSPLFVEE